ncbi:Tol-Pal system beta propeller repeat protein TolB [Pseudemcibacter aquimaris]|uniref:Tol-Pal system beta propeller repeat protein TolB n=1 Tax=Pseudemcibacter aquimaris TaxID=2857064 RepID=UPI002011EC52|nr:Tol-Pal system beta propeller repeat protein TolB [Pseudemcibacter aquimaris]MCC3862187.1 Tol-Pal system beta propeller repeat protein TolB [Pseudemcibacter aquimaris]WDU58940.1 Tol-Pal system beta propeller repeat protein TolB [Pseudemcibacter aquimaris]
MKHLKILLISLVGFALGTLSSHAVIEIDITQGNVQPMPIALANLVGSDQDLTSHGTGRELGQQIIQVITSDLERSGLFAPIDQRAFINSGSASTAPQFANWRAIGAQALVTGNVALREDGQVSIEFMLWDVFDGRMMEGKRLTASPRAWRKVAHQISDLIYERLTGEKGYFDTRIVYIAEHGPYLDRIRRLAIMDQDGHNHQFMTDGSYMILSPRFSPTEQVITYLSFYNDMPRVYLFDLETGKSEMLGEFDGMTFAPRFSPDGESIIMSKAERGNSDIFSMDLRTRQIARLTSHSAIDTSPSYSPFGRQIAFNSDRGGTQQIYVMDADGSNVNRISFGEGRYATPVWSPRGDLIAFTKQLGGKFYIGVMRPDGSGERILTESYFEEGPTWAPNGRVLMYYRKYPYDNRGGGGETQLWSIDLTGYNERQIITPLDGSDPAWSPLMD